MNPQNYTRGSSGTRSRGGHFSLSVRARRPRRNQIGRNRYSNEALSEKCVGERFSLKKRPQRDANKPAAQARVSRVPRSCFGPVGVGLLVARCSAEVA